MLRAIAGTGLMGFLYARDEMICDVLRVEAIYQVYASLGDMTRDSIQPINTWMAHFKTKCIMNNLTMLLLSDVAPLYVL